jgi:hypothetical protein
VEFCISRDVIGADRDLAVLGDERTWCDASQLENLLLLSSSVDHERADRSLNALMTMCGISSSFAPPQRFVSAMQLLVTGTIEVPWQKVMPRPDYDRFVDSVVAATRQFLPNAPVGYFGSVFRELSGLFQALQPAVIDRQRLKEIARSESNSSQLEVVKTFLPINDGMTMPVIYDRTHRTGRLTVASGPQILTLKREYRNLLTSRYEGGRVYYLDYTSLEPRVILQYAGAVVPRDIYDHISNGLLGGQYSRDVVKQITISLLYGAGTRVLATSTGLPSKELRAVIAIVKKFLDIDCSAKKLVAECVTNGGFVTNQFGRHVRVSTMADHIVLNAYTQSTAVDLALMGFKWIVDRVVADNLRCVPLFVLHDALLVDCHPDDVVRLDTIRSQAETCLPGTTGVFPIKFEPVS